MTIDHYVCVSVTQEKEFAWLLESEYQLKLNAIDKCMEVGGMCTVTSALTHHHVHFLIVFSVRPVTSGCGRPSSHMFISLSRSVLRSFQLFSILLLLQEEVNH